MSLYDYFGHSIAGLQKSQALLDQAAVYVANPANWGMELPATPSSYYSFEEYLSNAAAPGNCTSPNRDESRPPPPPSGRGVTAYTPLAGLGVGEGMAPQFILDAMICALMALRMYQANARMIAIENKVVGIIIHLGEENYREE